MLIVKFAEFPVVYQSNSENLLGDLRGAKSLKSKTSSQMIVMVLIAPVTERSRSSSCNSPGIRMTATAVPIAMPSVNPIRIITVQCFMPP